MLSRRSQGSMIQYLHMVMRERPDVCRAVRSIATQMERRADATLNAQVRPQKYGIDIKPAAASVAGDHHTVDHNNLLQHSDTFMSRHIGPSHEEVAAMCEVIGVKDIDDLIKQTIPDELRRKDLMAMHQFTLSEVDCLEKLKTIMDKNVLNKNFIGQGYSGTYLPPVIARSVLENQAWYTSYTPYQAEISQGRLESLMNFQTLVSELTGMELANASLLDEGTSAAEAVSMVARSVSSSKKLFFISDQVHPQTIDVVVSRAEWAGIKVIVGDYESFDFKKKNLMGALVQYPDTRGVLTDFTGLADTLHEHGAQLVMACDPLALTIAKPPAEMGADIAVGTMQRFGIPMLNGGPAAGYFATSKANARKLPGRIVGVSIDARGDPAIRMALQTREQHIRLNKATSNICTAQALLANLSAMYGIYHGPTGLKRIAARTHGLAQLFSIGLANMGLPIVSTDFFDTVTINVAPINASFVVDALAAQQMNIRKQDTVHVSVSFDETHTEKDVDGLLHAFQVALATSQATVMGNFRPLDAPVAAVDGVLPERFRRTSSFLTQDIFNTIQTETEMLRYMYRLEKKDLSLATSMIPLGSCTMKLNSTSSMLPVGWATNASIHPFTPVSQISGYRQMLHELEQYLCTVTNFDAVSLQPMSGAHGEYAGLVAIRQYHESIGEGHRNICIIPKSAHGTNPASAAMIGLEIKWIDDSDGLDITKLEAMCNEFSEDLSCIMITYPSTHGTFEPNIREIIATIHKHGGNVYMDGANMNAQLGLTSPGFLGADVCHLNLHKTFSIPHGGGGPGLGPVCVKKHLAPFLPNHSVINLGQMRGGALSSAPFGQAGIAVIPWMFITMLGAEGLRRSSSIAILNANYMMERLRGHYKIYSRSKRCSHEFIMDISDIRKSTGIVEEDIAKRLQDYGFHAPTMSWPVSHSLMIEPTESESKGELDRLADSLICIREEIRKIETGEWDLKDNPLKNAPHPQIKVCASEWPHCYTREEAAFPAPWVHQHGKFWPSTGRINNQYGDKNLVVVWPKK